MVCNRLIPRTGYRYTGAQNEPIRLCHETIYQAIYAMPKGNLRTDTIALLRFGHNKRRPRSRGCDRRGQIFDMTSIGLTGKIVPKPSVVARAVPLESFTSAT